MRRGVDRGLVRFSLPLAAVLLAIVAQGGAAQGVRGHVDDQQHRPLIGALVEFHDSTGRVAARAITTASGTYQLTLPSPGRYSYRVAAIGFRPEPYRSLVVPAAGVVLPDVTLVHVMVELPEIVALAHGRYCGTRRPADDLFVQILNSAQNAMQIMAATIATHQVAFTVAQIHTRTVYGAFANFAVSDTTVQPMSRWPIQSIDPDTLRAVGFSRTLEPGDEATREYYGPDERVLFSDWFLASHCFTVEKPRHRGAADTIHVRFNPAHKTRLVDVSGDLALDARDLSLFGFSFDLTNLPGWMPDRSAGGNMQFSRLASGLWMTKTWAIWAPVAGISPYSDRLSVGGEVETYGWVMQTIRSDSAAAH